LIFAVSITAASAELSASAVEWDRMITINFGIRVEVAVTSIGPCGKPFDIVRMALDFFRIPDFSKAPSLTPVANCHTFPA
jgi:hypothetical protein